MSRASIVSMLDSSLAAPLYRQLANEIEESIRSGALDVGARLPSEHELAEQHHIGRPTVRQATDWLARQGLVERRRGSGTFVIKPREPVDLFTLAGTLAAFAGAGLALKTKIVQRVHFCPCIKQTGNALFGKAAFVFARVGRVQKTTVLLERMTIDAATFPRFDTLPLASQPLSTLVEQCYRLRPTGGQQHLRVVHLGGTNAEWLHVSRGTAALLVERTLDFATTKAALFAEMYVLTNRVRLTQRLGITSMMEAEL